MGLLLKEALRRLCIEIGWSYAVFWKAIGCGNLRHLVWEEGCYEPTRASGVSGISGLDATESLLKEWGVVPSIRNDHLGELKCQGEDIVGFLVNKIMLPHIHVVGDGIVGRAAATGNHQWILQNSLIGEKYASEGLNEMKHQFLAGIQTIAIIPVLPHGVVQLGSTQMVMENTGFVNHVRSLFVQLGCMPGALLSDSTKKMSGQKIQVHATLGSLISAGQSGFVNTFLGDNCNQKNLKFPASGPVILSSCSSVKQFHDNVPPKALEVPLTSGPIFITRAMSINDFLQPKTQPVVEPILPLNGRPDDGSMGAQVVSNTDVQLNQLASMHESSSGRQHQGSVVCSGLSSDSLTFLEQQLLSGIGSEKSVNKLSTLYNTQTLPRPHGCTGSSSHKDSVIVSLLGASDSLNSVNDLGLSSLLCGRLTTDKSGSPNNNPSGTGAPQTLYNTNPSNRNHVPSGEITLSHPSTVNALTRTVATLEKENVENDLFQAFNFPFSDSSEQASCSGSLLGFYQGCWLSSSNPVQGSQSCQNGVCEENDTPKVQGGQNATFNDGCKSLHTITEDTSDVSMSCPSGCDLFDALGPDFKSRLFHRSLDVVCANKNVENAWASGTDVSTCITSLDADPVFDAMHDGISCSGTFSETGPDQLLDAVVSKFNSGARQSSDNSASCKAAVTKMSSSSLHISPPKYSWVASSEQMQGELFGFSPTVLKAETPLSGSLKSACSMDKIGECSQRDGDHKSQISLWVENGQNMKSDDISAAHCKGVEESGKSNRKRPRPGESPRPRPKDRQMIQDRVKELREIVPNGAKCSIDALLERTIKHMLFLQSVTKHADKLKETGEPKIISKEGGLLLKDNFEGGATWAFEVGTQSMICPIIVEDLNPPRQLLVEMLCEERGFFLEIADLIRGLGLTILKGVMEARNNKVWARFAVEANRDVTRMDIFMSLVRLLEPTMEGGMPTQGIDVSKIAHNMFCQSSIPVTGLSSRLQ